MKDPVLLMDAWDTVLLGPADELQAKLEALGAPKNKHGKHQSTTTYAYKPIKLSIKNNTVNQ